MIYRQTLGFILISCFLNLYFRKYADPALTCFEPETMGNMIVGMDFHKFYFDHGKRDCNDTLLKEVKYITGFIMIGCFKKCSNEINLTFGITWYHMMNHFICFIKIMMLG